MKLNPNSTHLPISKHEVIHPTEVSRTDIDRLYVHPWYKHLEKQELKKPNPPSKEAVKRAKFVDKTYHWKRGNDSIRSRN